MEVYLFGEREEVLKRELQRVRARAVFLSSKEEFLSREFDERDALWVWVGEGERLEVGFRSNLSILEGLWGEE